MKAAEDEAAKKWAAERFGIKPEEVVWHHSGICYDSIVVATQEAADKVTAAVKGKHVNGGLLHGMELGKQSFDEKGIRVMV